MENNSLSEQSTALEVIEHSTKAQTKLLDRLNNIRMAKKITKRHICEQTDISQATLTRIFSDKTAITFKQLDQICSALHISISEITDENNTQLDTLEGARTYCHASSPDLVQPRGNLIDKYYNGSLKEIENYQNLFLFNPDHPAFNGMLTNDKEAFCFYTKPTVSNQISEFVKGKLSLKHSGTNPPYCRVELNLTTPISKSYVGEMMISLPMKTCYILLFSAERCEVCLMSFHHMYLNNESLRCRMCGMLTTSSGSRQRPVFEKAIISRTELDDDALKEIEGQFKMNDASIFFESSLMTNSEWAGDLELLNEIANAEQIEKTTYCEINEGFIRSSRKLDARQKTDLINALRRIGRSGSYAKVSSHADDFLYDFVQKIRSQSKAKGTI